MNTAIEQIRAGVEAHLNGNLKAAESAYLAALTVDAANATAHNNLGFIYGQCQRWDEALLHLRTALDLKPDLSMAHSNLGQVLMNLGLAEEGMEHLEKAVDLDSENLQAWDNLGRFCLHAGNFQRAEYSWLRALGILPHTPHLMVRLGTAIAAQGRFDEAIELYQQVLRNHPIDVDAWAQLGVCYFLRRDFGSCQSALERALTIKADDHIALRHLGLVHIALGAKQEAEAVFAELLRHYPGDQETLLDLAVLQLSLDNPATALAKLEQLYIKDATNERIRFYLALALRACGEPARASDFLRDIAGAQGLYAQKARQILDIH